MKKLFMLFLVLSTIVILSNASYSAQDWTKTYGSGDWYEGRTIQQTSDGGYIVAGYTHSFGAGEHDFWVLRFDSNGEIPDCDIIGTSDAIASSTSIIGQDCDDTGPSPSLRITNTNIMPQDTSVEIMVICYHDSEDSDGDGVGDACDNCPSVADSSQINSDNDSHGDACEAACQTKIYRGEHCSSGEEIPFNRSGKHGLAMGCCEVLELCVCSSCDCEDTGFTWEIAFTDPPGYELDFSLTPKNGTSTVFDIVTCPDELVTITIKVTDCFGNEDFIEVYVAKIFIGIGRTNAHPNSETTAVELLLNNPEHHVKAITVDVCSCLHDECADLQDCTDDYCMGNTDQTSCEAVDVCKWDVAAEQCVLGWCEQVGSECVAIDNIVCTECIVNEYRTPEFICSAAEQADGCCRVVLYSIESDDLIQQGSGAIAKIKYDIGGDLSSKDCLCLWPFNREVLNQFNEEVCACGDAGEICFYLMGDIYPQDCYECTSCGEGKVDLFDVLEGVDIILGRQAASECQKLHGDVPLGMPPYCGEPASVNPPNCETDGEISVSDVVVIIDKMLSKLNCCDYCMFVEVY